MPSVLRFLSISCASAAVLLGGCATPVTPKPGLADASLQRHEIRVRDFSGLPVTRARVVAQTMDMSEFDADWDKTALAMTTLTKEVSCTTDERGVCTIEVPVKLKFQTYRYWTYLIPPASSTWCVDDCYQRAGRAPTVWEMHKKLYGADANWGYASYVRLNIYGGGLFGPVSEQAVAFHKSPGPYTQVTDVRGLTVQDYFCPILKGDSNRDAASSILKWSRSLLGSVASERADLLQKGGVCVAEFKAKPYIAVSLLSNLRFNAGKLNDYAIGVSVFDEIVRGVMRTLGGADEPQGFFGYDISVQTRRENFVNPSNAAEVRNLQFRFLIPRDVAQRYKNKDVTGQQVIDQSVVLLNDERIDLKLQ